MEGDRFMERIVLHARGGLALLHRTRRYSISALICFIFLYAIFFSPPSGLKTPALLHIEPGTPLSSIAEKLEQGKLIRHPWLFSGFIVLIQGERGAVAGTYFISKPQNVLTLAARIVSGRYEVSPVKVTFPEGSTVRDMSSILEEKLGDFDTAAFVSLAGAKEGHLFPDTYYFLPGESPERVMQTLEETFSEKIQSLREDISSFGKPLSDVVVMASLLEKEARTTDSRRIIAGILWKRLEGGMRLQVDAVFPYIIGKNTYQLTTEDLAVDSPYNTYRNKGLPPGAIGNPGLDALRAAVTPLGSPYFFYLSDKEGVFHYSSTHEEHVQKKRQYLGS